ncbi:UNC-50 family protein [Hortaea werneckii]|nr:UNC-50 family protein [Hortaea werneckii]KAI7564299.1 UNC-50 family protein [Hortaea werneckii]KAI7614357.1 UNC-50 family protein [Hortaea werneckii]KAI7624641.1 UNC-50 family protein [Hortaea werneckii]KAI7667015.1 UNC-50 family protein [Hortaea werneckii]
MKVPPFFRRLFKFTSMDFETAVWEMINLIIAPKKVFRNIYYHVQTKNSYHRADPAFTYLLSLFFWLTGLAWGLAYADGFGRAVKISFAFVLFHLLGSSVIVSTLMYFLVGKVLGKRRQGLFGPPNGGEEELEFGYCFDVSIRAFTPIWVFLYVLQFLLMPLIAQDYWVSNFFGNTMFLLALSYYFIIIFLGFNALPFLSRTEVLLAPIPVLVILWVISLFTFDCATNLAPVLWCGVNLRKPLVAIPNCTLPTRITSSISTDTTFRNFTAQQAAAYASGRGGSYPQPLYETILDFHLGNRDLCMDRRQRADDRTSQNEALFRHLNHRTTFLTAEDAHCGDPTLLHHAGFNPNSIDLVTVAMAAHWFQSPAFYLSAAQALRPGGTLAIWTTSSYFCHPSVPGYREIQTLLHTVEDERLGPYTTPGNRLARQCYDDLPLPWSPLPPSAAAGGEDAQNPCAALFDEAAFERKHWDRDRVPSALALPDCSSPPFLLGREVDLHGDLKGLGSSWPVIRWREANPGKVGTEQDPIRVIADRLKRVVGEQTKLVLAPSCTVLLFRRT